MDEILHHLRLVVYPTIYRVLYIPGGDRRISEPSTVTAMLVSGKVYQQKSP